MATLTKKDLLEAIKDMPMDARISMEIWDYGTQCIKALEGVSYDKDNNIIDLC